MNRRPAPPSSRLDSQRHDARSQQAGSPARGLDFLLVGANLGRRYNVGGDRTRYRGLVRWLGRVRPLLGVWRALPERSRRAFARWFFFEVAPRRAAPVELVPTLRSELVCRYLPEVHRLEEILCRSAPWPEFRA